MSPHGWAVAVIDRGRLTGEIPRYGSPAWCALPPNDPRAIAACVAAAEAWRQHCDPATVRRDLELELTANAQLEKTQEATDFRELAQRVRHLSSVPTQRELDERRRAAVTR
jgi:hypothetical protein